MKPMGIERHRWAGREAKVSGTERVNRTLSRSGRVDGIQSHRQGELRGLSKLVNITEDVRKYAAENALDETVALEHGMQQKAVVPAQRCRNLFQTMMNRVDANRTR